MLVLARRLFGVATKPAPSFLVLPAHEAIKFIPLTSKAYFDQSVQLVLNLGLDIKKNEHRLRGNLPLPHSNGKTVTIAVFARGDKVGW